MRFLALLLLTCTLAAGATTAGAQPRPTPAPKASPTTFDRTTTFQSCQTVTQFACGMTDAGGHRYGTAHERTMCTRYTFQPNGTFNTQGNLATEHGTYKLSNKTVTLTVVDEDPDTNPFAFALTLSSDGEKLGDMTRQLR
ncbi:MAG: hypothetical protein IPQ07_13010 [Myxococcales bacterium]|nr:hypothetical protein [Myxococcales bacterium]